MTAHRVSWELEHGSVPAGAKVLGCSGEPACVRVEHLELIGGEAPLVGLTRRTVSSTGRQRSRKGAGSMQTPPFLIDDETVAMLQRQCELMDERAVGADSGGFRTPVLADSVQRFWGFSYTPSGVG